MMMVATQHAPFKGEAIKYDLLGDLTQKPWLLSRSLACGSYSTIPSVLVVTRKIISRFERMSENA